jgi:hypothetical protein
MWILALVVVAGCHRSADSNARAIEKTPLTPSAAASPTLADLDAQLRTMHDARSSRSANVISATRGGD